MKRLILSLCAVAALALPAATANAGPHGHYGHHGPRAHVYRGHGRGYDRGPGPGDYRQGYGHGYGHGYRRWQRYYAPAVRHYPSVRYYGPEFYPAYRSGFSYSSPGFSFYLGM